MIAGVAAGHPATAAAGVEILRAGGSAADAAVAACLASCVAETVMTGLLGGAHAIHWDGETARNLDGFCAVPSGRGADLVQLEVPFGAELVLAVLTNSWKGSTAIRPFVEELGLFGASDNLQLAPVEGTYALDGTEAVVADGRVTERETDPVTGAMIERRYPYSADATLMSWRSDFPRDGVGRIGWTAMPRLS